MILRMGRTALYRDPVPFRPARAEVQLDLASLYLRMPDGRTRYHALDGCTVVALDGFVDARIDLHRQRRFVRMLLVEGERERLVLITPPDHGAVAPNVVRVPEAPAEAAILDPAVFEAASDWLLGGGRLAACAIGDLARLATIATAPFAAVIGEVAAQRALEQVWAAGGPLRGGSDLETALRPLIEAARHSARADEALVAALAYASGHAAGHPSAAHYRGWRRRRG